MGKKISVLIEKQIIDLYIDNNSYEKITTEYGFPKSTIGRVLKRNNIIIRKDTHNKTPEDVEFLAIESYKSGMDYTDILIMYNIGDGTFKRILKRNNINKYTCPERSLNYIKKLNDMGGKNNPNYKLPKNRITPLRLQIRNSSKYSEWRTQIFGRDNFTCQYCHARGTWLEAHHIKRFSEIMKENNIKTLEDAYICQELWYLNNGVTLCKECHNLTKGPN